MIAHAIVYNAEEEQHVFLPSDASFQLQPHTDGESITNAFHSNNVGNLPQAKVTIVTHNGLISVNKRF